jgi:hypothetical protein
MENRTHTDQSQTRRLPFNDPFPRRRQDEELDDEVNRMENEGGPPPVRSKDGGDKRRATSFVGSDREALGRSRRPRT